ncbi:AMP-binding protein [Frankia sp. CNm7]|uniref:AMP-binding protein n=1 Tax=Frankia nepalensis TaxID=1836974 RepID=A0A937RHK2_9ACTN|nr:AMP-binding protein [Frankia nepalensis]MBL7494810.1 AMP-binding protein [Frankia nepalensis]MBL7514107.1 AMP-binding protein [Frankia nepalensis]MBL7524768.1 AMP-binding protein [Frankia nepalensis]MBL7626513.1 AMP-binding protein [Frankia nepalensis]
MTTAASSASATGRTQVPPLGADEVEGNIVDRFRLVASLCSDAEAVRSPRGSLTFGELDRWSDELADRLLDGSAAAEEADRPVALLLGHEPAAAVAMIAILKAGRPFVPLDTHLPSERLATILELAGATACVVAGPDAGYGVGGMGGLPDGTETAPDPGGLLPRWVEPVPVGRRPKAGFATGPRAAEAAPSGAAARAPGRAGAATRAPRRAGADPAILIFTSGSTGVPKGVVWNHDTFLYHHLLFQNALAFGPEDRKALVLPLSFISGVGVLLRCLVAGAVVSMYDPRVRGLRDLPGWLRAERPTILVVTPSLLRGAMGALEPGEVLEDLRFVQTVGEALYSRDVRLALEHLPAGGRVVTTYGSSESGLVTLGMLGAGDELPDGGVVSAGRLVPGKEVRLLAEDGADAPAGEAGEIVVRSDYVAGGYWRNPEQTATRFGVDEAGSRFYRTGDYGRFGADGALRITGRLDGMVKIRGYLVEPIEVEATLLAADEIADAVVTADKAADPPRLVAYVVPSPLSRPSASSIRRLLRSRLPAYMVPSTIVTMTTLPRTERGKVDRLALPPAPPALAGDPPSGSWEEAVAALWARVLNLEAVGVHDDFTELGGDSLAAQEVAARMAGELKVRLPTSALAQAPTVAELAVLAARATAETDSLRHPDVLPLRTGGTGTPLFCFAGAGGLAVGMLGLAARFDGERPVYGMQAHGIEHRGIPDWTVRGAARRHAHHIRLLQPEGPYLLLGHSFGGLVAFETARQLTAAGERVGLLTLVDTAPPRPIRLPWKGEAGSSGPTGAADWSQPVLAQEPDGSESGNGRWSAPLVLASRAAQLARLPLTGFVRFAGKVQYDAFYNQGRVVSMVYRPGPWDGRALLWLAAPDAVDTGPRPVPAVWAPLLTGGLAVSRTVVGNHDSVLREPLVGELADDIRRQLSQLEDVT